MAETPFATIDRVVIDLASHTLPVTKYLSAGPGKRPVVLLLHGSKGVDAQAVAYDRYARDLAGAGLDAWLFSYYRPSEACAIGQAADGAERERLYARFVEGWVDLVHGVAAEARRQIRSSGKVGILGFSLGGMVGVAAANGAAFSALAVFYACAPKFYRSALIALPPLLDIHGEADHSVPLAAGSELIAAARRLGGTANLAIYKGQTHGFDLDLANPMSEPARRSAVAFLAKWLGPQVSA
jgi:carboxymethylenebutenolidase